ncbi:hypothetical protein DIPPA_09904 [Diplonema papillatum]|nr:hypothetical protein DIPPA_09904 [Diplonema papillatum]
MVAIELVGVSAGAVGLLWFLGKKEEPAAAIPDDQRYALRKTIDPEMQTNITTAALNGLKVTPQYTRWRQARLAALDKEVRDATASNWRMHKQILATFAVLALYLVANFKVATAKSDWDTIVGKLVLVQMLLCCDEGIHASAFASFLTLHLLYVKQGFGVGFYLWVAVLFLKAYLTSQYAKNPETQPATIEKRFEAFEHLDHAAIANETYVG